MNAVFGLNDERKPSQAKRNDGAIYLPLNVPFEQIGSKNSCSRVSLEPLSNRLELGELRRFLHRATHLLEVGGQVSFIARDPDDYPDNAWPGELCRFDERPEHVRPLRQILELLRLFPLRVRTPRTIDGAARDGFPAGRFLQWTAERMATAPTPDKEDSTHPIEERYAPTTEYRRFDRLEEPETADDLYYAASRLRPLPGESLLALGVNDGRELEMFAPDTRDRIEMWGIDHSASAIEAAKLRHPRHASRMRLADLADLSELELPPIHCALLLNVLQCTSVDRDRLLRDLMPLLTTDARLLASIPNCHFGPNDILRRPLRRDDPRHDRSLVFKDARFLARTFYRAGFRQVELFGTLDVFLLARR